MRRLNTVKLVFTFTAFTILITWFVIFTYGHYLRQPFYGLVESLWPNNVPLQDQIEQSVEHFFISAVVDIVVVTLLLRLVNHQQRELHDSEERYRALFEHASDGIGVVTASDHVLVDINKKFSTVLGYDHQYLIGKHICELFEKNSQGMNRDIFSKKILCDISAPVDLDAHTWFRGTEITIETASGNPLVVSVSCSAVLTGNEKLFMLIIRDMTEHILLEREKQEMQRQLFQTSKLASIGELSAGVAHEINNPLNAVVNFAQLLKDDGVARNQTEQQMLDGIIEEGHRIAKIVRDLLTFARQDPHMPVQVTIAEVVKNSVSLFGHQLEKDEIEVEVDISQDTFPVRADASRLRQVFVNIISNAHHALQAGTADKRLLRITGRNVERGGKQSVSIVFYDNGTGIRREHIDKVFDPFFTTRRDSGGTGLGLSLSFGIIHDYGGNITVESDGTGFTRFVVELPASTKRSDEYGEDFVGGRRAEHSLDDGGTAQARGL
ncbi:MAG: ATP-binding protein [Blastocatellia bacterium]